MHGRSANAVSDVAQLEQENAQLRQQLAWADQRPGGGPRVLEGFTEVETRVLRIAAARGQAYYEQAPTLHLQRHMSNIRRKLKAIGAEIEFRTYPGQGYTVTRGLKLLQDVVAGRAKLSVPPPRPKYQPLPPPAQPDSLIQSDPVVAILRKAASVLGTLILSDQRPRGVRLWASVVHNKGQASSTIELRYQGKLAELANAMPKIERAFRQAGRAFEFEFAEKSPMRGVYAATLIITKPRAQTDKRGRMSAAMAA